MAIFCVEKLHITTSSASGSEISCKLVEHQEEGQT